MLEDIKKIGISSEFYETMLDILGYDIVLGLACNYEKVQKNMEILKSLGISDVLQLLLERPDIFLKEPESITKSFAKFNVAVLVGLINDDFTVIDEVFN